MKNRDKILAVLDVCIHLFCDARDIVSISPDFKTLLRYLDKFRDFLVEESKKQN